MRLSFLDLPPEERRLYIEEAAARRGISAIVLEKDFWVSWLLAVLFASRFAGHLVFKGGTSLSKVFGVIDRFSEDIDLSVSPEFLGLGDSGTSRNQATKWMAQAEAACGAAVEQTILPELERLASEVLGERPGGWFEYLLDRATHSPVIPFRYPTIEPKGFEYLKRSVKLEFGSLTDQKPAGRHELRPWIADILDSAFADWACEVVSLEAERTFWEKATILHAECHRPPDKSTPDRFSRHYADTAALAVHPIAEVALEQTALRDRVVEWKARFFGSSWARYDLARPGTFGVVPGPERISDLRRDYQAMRVMYLSEPPEFDEVIERLKDLEHRINRP